MASPAPSFQSVGTNGHQFHRLTQPLFSTLHVHVIFVLASESARLNPDHVETVEGRLSPLCAAKEAELLKAQVVEDHLHLLIEYPPAVTLIDLLETLQASLTEWRWNPKIFAGSCSRPDLTQQMRHYIEAVRSTVVTNPGGAEVSPLVPFSNPAAAGSASKKKSERPRQRN